MTHASITREIDRIETDLKRNGVSVDSFCTRVGIDRATWQRWKAGTHSPRVVIWQTALDVAADVSNRNLVKKPCE